MDATEATEPSAQEKKYLTVRQASFTGVGAMVGAGIFALLGFGIITFTAKDLAKPSRQLPRAMYLALGIAMIIYVAIALGVFGTLTVEKL